MAILQKVYKPYKTLYEWDLEGNLLKIYDNGENEKKEYNRFLMDRNADSGMGLMDIYQRADKLNGHVNISSDSKGFVILVTLPKEA